MKERVEHLITEFVDYKGLKHPVVLVAVSKELPTIYGEAFPKDISATEEERDTSVYYEVHQSTEWDNDYLGSVVKCLYLGVAICNPEDTFSEKKGIAKAKHRALNAKPVMWVTKNGYINKKMVQAFLEQEAEHIHNNPGQYIEGYNESRDAFNHKNDMRTKYENLNSEDKQIVSILAKVDAKKLEELKSLVKVHNETL